MHDVRRGEVGPALRQLDPDRVAIEADRLSDAGADAAHRVDDEVARIAVALDRTTREFGEHLAGMPEGLRHVAAVSLPLARALRARPDGRRDV